MMTSGAPRTSLENRLGVAIAHLNVGNLAVAADECAALARQAPDHPAVLQLEATIALRAGRARDASEAAERSLRLRPGHGPTLLIAGRAAQDLGVARQRAGDPLSALSYFARAQTIPSAMTPTAWFVLGLAHQDVGDEKAAAPAYDAALAGRPDFAEAAVNLGIARQRLGDMPAAMEAYRRAVAIRPDTLGRIAQAVTAAGTGMLWLDPAAFRRALGA